MSTLQSVPKEQWQNPKITNFAKFSQKVQTPGQKRIRTQGNKTARFLPPACKLNMMSV